MLFPFLRSAALFVAALLCASPAFGIVVGEIDTFEDGTTEGWFVGGGPSGGISPNPPEAIPTGGPDGVDDAYMLLTSIGGEQPGGRLVVNNAGQWAGDYLSAGVLAIALEVNNLGANDLFLRVLFEDPIPGPPANIAISATPILVTAGSGWQTILLPVTPGSLQAVLGSVEDALSNATFVRIFSSEDPEFPPQPSVASLGVDNIRAVPAVIPEPATAVLMGAGLAAGWLRRKRR